MKLLENQTLLYDDDCPLCRVYTKGFIEAGMLDENGKKPYCQLSEEEQVFIDLKRAANEIALVDTKNKTVLYGIDSLLKVIGHSFPWMKTVGYWKPVNWFLKKLYKFISYNRKVIIPSKINQAIKLQCVPEFNIKYRIFYIIFASIITTLTLYKYANLIEILPKGSLTREAILAIGQLGFQSLFLMKFDKQKTINYLGNLMTVSLLGSLILMPFLIANYFFKMPQIAVHAWFGLTVLLMFIDHFRRVKILELPTYLCLTWVLYRIIVLILILNY